MAQDIGGYTVAPTFVPGYLFPTETVAALEQPASNRVVEPLVGDDVGKYEGAWDGPKEGNSEGVTDGRSEGVCEGAKEGKSDGV